MESEAKAMRKIKWGVMGTAFICEEYFPRHAAGRKL